MKRKILSLLLCSVVLSGTVCGCESKSDLSQSGSSTISEDDIPAEAKERLNKVHDTEPIKIPTEEWDFKTICSSIYINGKQFSYPCTINELGEGFEILDTEEYKLKYDKDKKTVSCYLSYYGKTVVRVRLYDCQNIADISDSPIGGMAFMQKLNKDYVFPISFNGVTIGDNIERVLDRLSFLESYSNVWEDGTEFYSFNYENEDIKIYCLCINDCVTDISFNFNQNKDKSLDIKFRMNGNWNGGVAVYVEPDTDD